MALYYVSHKNDTDNDFESRPFDRDAFWQNVAKASGIDPSESQSNQAQPRRLPLQRYVAVAALLTIGFFGFKYISNQSQQAPTTRSYSTTTAQRATILLGDGTRVTLAPQTRIQYGDDYGKNRRDIHLEGEAYFEVASQPNKPMVIFTGNTTTQVLGTSFSVRKYSNEKSVRVAVTSGKVAFTGAGVLKRGDIAEFTSTGTANVRHDSDVEGVLSWRNGRIAFNNAPVRNVLPELERWYNLKLSVGTPGLGGRHITAAFERETQSEMIAALSTILGAKANRQGDSVTFIAVER